MIHMTVAAGFHEGCVGSLKGHGNMELSPHLHYPMTGLGRDLLALHILRIAVW